MATAAVFAGEEADDELIRLWKSAARAAARELMRIDAVKEEKRTSGRGAQGGARHAGRRRSSSGAQTARQRQLRELDEQRTETLEAWQEYVIKLMDYGFRIDDPDVRELKERQRDYDSDEWP